MRKHAFAGRNTQQWMIPVTEGTVTECLRYLFRYSLVRYPNFSKGIKKKWLEFLFIISNFKSEDRSIIFFTFKARVPGGFRYLSEPQELLVIDFQDPAQVKDALKNTKFLSRQFKVLLCWAATKLGWINRKAINTSSIRWITWQVINTRL